MNKEYNEFWENCGLKYAHLIETSQRREDHFFNGYKELLFDYIDSINLELKNKTVIDYGCGGGFLGKYLFRKYQIKKYIGLDIAKRSLAIAENNLINCEEKEFHIVPVRFSNFNADFLFSFSVFQHLPSKKSLKEILININNSGIKYIGLHYRHSEEIIFNNNYNIKNGNIGLCCLINSEYLEKKLTNYKIKYTSEMSESGGRAVFLELQ